MKKLIEQSKSFLLLIVFIFLVIGLSGCETKKAQQEKADNRQEKADNIISQAKVYAEQMDYPKAIETYKQIYDIEHSDSYQQVSFEMAKIYIKQRNYGEALRKLDIYASNSADPEIFTLWIQARMGSDNPVEWKEPNPSAYKTIEKATSYVNANPEKVEVLRYLGVLYSHASDFDFSNKASRAVEICRNAISLKPDDAAGYYFLAIAYSKDWSKRLNQAEEACLKAIQLKPDYHDAHTLLGTIFWRQASSRFHYYSNFIVEDGSVKVLNAQKGSAEERKKQAMEELMKSISLKPTAWAWFKLGEYASDRNIKLDDLALEAYKNAAEIDPFYPGVHTMLGHTFRKNKQWADAVKSYEIALKIDSFDPGASTYIVEARKELDKQTPL